MPKAPACCRAEIERGSETEAAELARVQMSAPSLEDDEVVPVPVFEDHKPAETLDRAAAADASGQPMTSDKEAEEPMTDKPHQPMTNTEEQPKQGRGLKRSRSADTALDKSAG